MRLARKHFDVMKMIELVDKWNVRNSKKNVIQKLQGFITIAIE